MTEAGPISNMTNIPSFPLFDSLVKQYGIEGAAVFGVIYRHTKSKDGDCIETQKDIAIEAGVSKRAVSIFSKRLVDDGYLTIIDKDNLDYQPVYTIRYINSGKIK